MELILATGDVGIIEAFTKYFPQVRCIHQPNLSELNAWDYDSALLMGNGYGIFEDAYNQAFNDTHPNSEFNIRETISDEFGGVLPVGAAVATPLTDDAINHGWLIYASLNRLSGTLQEPSSVYWASRAGFYQARKHMQGRDIKQLLISAYGLEHLPLMSVLAQMRLAYEHVFETGVDDSNWNTISQTEAAIATVTGAI